MAFTCEINRLQCVSLALVALKRSRVEAHRLLPDEELGACPSGKIYAVLTRSGARGRRSENNSLILNSLVAKLLRTERVLMLPRPSAISKRMGSDEEAREDGEDSIPVHRSQAHQSPQV